MKRGLVSMRREGKVGDDTRASVEQGRLCRSIGWNDGRRDNAAMRCGTFTGVL